MGQNTQYKWRRVVTNVLTAVIMVGTFVATGAGLLSWGFKLRVETWNYAPVEVDYDTVRAEAAHSFILNDGVVELFQRRSMPKYLAEFRVIHCFGVGAPRPGNAAAWIAAKYPGFEAATPEDLIAFGANFSNPKEDRGDKREFSVMAPRVTALKAAREELVRVLPTLFPRYAWDAGFGKRVIGYATGGSYYYAYLAKRKR